MAQDSNRMRAHRAAGACLVGLCLAGLLISGCSDRRLTILQDNYINTGRQVGRDEVERTGDPLQIDIVCVHPEDLKPNEHVGSGLGPDSGITAKEWFANRPESGYKGNEKDATPTRFRLPKDHIFVLCSQSDKDKAETWGTWMGPSLRGATLDGPTITVNGIKFRSSSLFDGNSVIYVFGRFTGVDQQRTLQVLPVKPAVFNPPGDYRASIKVHVGVDKKKRESDPLRGQFIENVTQKGR